MARPVGWGMLVFVGGWWFSSSCQVSGSVIAKNSYGFLPGNESSSEIDELLMADALMFEPAGRKGKS